MPSESDASGQVPGAGGEAPGRQKSGPRPPSAGNVAVVAVRMEAVLVWTVERVGGFPKSHRFTVGDRLIETCLDVQAALVEASFVRDKRALLLQASRGLVRARVLARLANTLRCLSNAQAGWFDGETVEVGKMIGGWLRSLTRPRPNEDVGPSEAR